MAVSVRRSVVIWYTVWMIVLILIVMAVVLSGGWYIADRQAGRILARMVDDAADEVEFDDGRIEVDDDAVLQGNGVFIGVYGSNGQRIAGYIPEDSPFPDFSDGTMRQENGWHIYDRYLRLERGHDAWIRGTARNYDGNAFISYANLIVLSILPLIAMLSAVGGYFIVKRSFRPLDKMIATAEDIAGGKDLSKRIGLGNGSSEIYKAAAAFDTMLDRIEESFRKEKQFTSDASHELRTPISVILAECDYASSHTDDSDEMTEAIGVIGHQARKMSSLVSELLYIARADRGTIKLEKEDVDVPELAEAVAETMMTKAEEKDISISVEASEPVIVNADRDMLMRVLINLISNAISYGHHGGHVWVRICKKEDKAVIEVADDGIGMKPEHLERIWDRFYQANPARSGSGGAGLGLPIVREIVSLHGGGIAVESTEGKGSVFRVSIPWK